jgi:hypothetical protein
MKCVSFLSKFPTTIDVSILLLLFPVLSVHFTLIYYIHYVAAAAAAVVAVTVAVIVVVAAAAVAAAVVVVLVVVLSFHRWEFQIFVRYEFS